MTKKALILLIIFLPMIANSQTKKNAKKTDTISAKAIPASNQQNSMKSLPDAMPGAKLLSFRLLTQDSLSFETKNLPKGFPVLLIIFNPLCDHCLKAAITIKEHIDLFKQVNIVFMTGLPVYPELKNFITACGLEGKKNIVFGAMPDEINKQLFQSNGIPQFMVYNKKKVLQKTFYTEMNVDSMLRYLKK